MPPTANEKYIIAYALQFLASNFDSATEDNKQAFTEGDVQELSERYNSEAEENPWAKSISDDDLCAECAFLNYNPGGLSTCQKVDDMGTWPAHFDRNGYAKECSEFDSKKIGICKT